MRDEGAQAGLRIGLFAHRLAGRHPTGIGRYFQELVRALALAGEPERLTVTSTREPGDPTWIPQAVCRATLPWPRRPVQLAWSMGTGPHLERSLGELAVVHLLQPFPPVRTHAPQVVTVHDLFPLEHPEWYRWLDRWTYQRSIDLLVRRAVRVIVPSEYVAQRVHDFLGLEASRMAVVPLGVSGVFSEGEANASVSDVCRRFGVLPGGYAVCVGAVSTRKNVVTLVRAAAELPRAGFPLVMVGPDGHGAEQVDTEIARLDRRARVQRTGYIPDADAAGLVRGAAVLLHPALGEGFGFVPLEAMAAGTPVIAARTSSVPEVVGDAAVLVDEATDPAAWGQAMATIMEDKERRDELARAGAERVKQFSWDRTARRMIEIYRDAASG